MMPASPATRLVVMGRQGAGKGTQCVRLAADLRLPHISTGDLLRAAVRDRTPLGVAAQQYMEAGELVPDEVIVGVVAHRLELQDCADGFILDGFPRTVTQARALADAVGTDGIDLAIDIEVPRDMVVRRLSARRVCTSCGLVTSVPDPHQDTSECAACGGSAERRSDDAPGAIARRLDLYDDQSGPLLDWFSARGILRVVDGTTDPDSVYSALRMLVDAPVPTRSAPSPA